jgi:GLPGLI family protein
MNKIVGTLALTIFVISGCAQVKSDKMFSVHYIAHFKLYAEAKEEITEERVLDIGEKSSCFYGRWQHLREEIVDSITAAGGSRDMILAKIMEYPTPRQFYTVYNNYPVIGKRTVTDQLIKRFHYEEDMDVIEWALLDGDTIVLDYPCKKAICNYRAHLWKVCYTPEIPVALGPWKLHGLPGLILAASDDTGVFSFECIEIRSDKKPMPVPNLSKSIKCTREEIKSMQRESFKNPEDFVKRYGAIGGGTDASGRPIVYKERTALFLD